MLHNRNAGRKLLRLSVAAKKATIAANYAANFPRSFSPATVATLRFE
jgi:hypothetical protein